uniref:HOOK_N domain-containing protein n=1 Tax=Anisakis simplex TaxID=6269 RepID=A0A0M3KII1_ANISI
LLLLLLGCAVQGDQREKFIERIKCMQTDLQTAIVQQIQRVTEDGEFILNIDDLEVDRGNEQSVSMLAHLERVIKERDTYANCLLEMAHEHVSQSINERLQAFIHTLISYYSGITSANTIPSS